MVTKAEGAQKRGKVKDPSKREQKLSKGKQKKVKGGGRSQGAATTASKGINPVQHSE